MDEVQKTIIDLKKRRAIVYACFFIVLSASILGTIGAAQDNFASFIFLAYYVCLAIVIIVLIDISMKIRKLKSSLKTNGKN